MSATIATKELSIEATARLRALLPDLAARTARLVMLWDQHTDAADGPIGDENSAEANALVSDLTAVIGEAESLFENASADGGDAHAAEFIASMAGDYLRNIEPIIAELAIYGKSSRAPRSAKSIALDIMHISPLLGAAVVAAIATAAYAIETYMAGPTAESLSEALTKTYEAQSVIESELDAAIANGADDATLLEIEARRVQLVSMAADLESQIDTINAREAA